MARLSALYVLAAVVAACALLPSGARAIQYEVTSLWSNSSACGVATNATTQQPEQILGLQVDSCSGSACASGGDGTSEEITCASNVPLPSGSLYCTSSAESR